MYASFTFEKGKQMCKINFFWHNFLKIRENCVHPNYNFPYFMRRFNIDIYYINTNEIPGELSRENLISSHVKISPLL